MIPTFTEKWHADPENRRWLNELLASDKFQLACHAANEARAPKWYSGAEGADALVNAASNHFRLQGFNDFRIQLEDLCEAPKKQEDPPLAELEDQAAKEYYKKTQGHDISGSDPTRHAMSENNEKRCIAHQIIHDLFVAKELGQIQLLYMACTLAYKGLDPSALLKAAENTVETLRANSTNPPT